MKGLVARCLCVLAGAKHALAIPYNHLLSVENASTPIYSHMKRDDSFDQTDLSFIKKLAAIGDSYSAGIGAGDKLGSISDALDPKSDWACARYDHSYPYYLYTDARFGEAGPEFQFLSCSGATSQDILDNQIPDLKSGQDAILVSVGGNDVGLIDVLNQCVFQYGVFNWDQVTVAEVAAKYDEKYKWASEIDFEKLGRGCPGQLGISSNLIDSTSFSNQIDKVLNAAKAKLASGGKVYLTGYAKFFGEDMSANCDKVSWSIWIYKLYNMFKPAEYLTVANRKTMNQLVDKMNSALAAAADRAGSDVIFVDYDKYVGEFGGRYCESGVDETASDSNTRPGLMFYEPSTLDIFGSDPWKRSTGDPLNATFQGQLEIFASIVEVMDPDVKYAIDAASSTSAQAKAATASEKRAFQVPNLLPDGYGRIFHPQILLHEMIANLVAFEMMNLNNVNAGLGELPEELGIDKCANTGPNDPDDPDDGIPDVDAPDFYARILPLGASIVWGVGSSNGNGFRKPLRDALRQAGFKVNMVGSKNNGKFKDNNVEAHSGDRVDQIQVKSRSSTRFQPNIIVINAGTNDCLQNLADGFTGRYNSMLDELYDAIPGVTIIVSTVLPGTPAGIVNNRDSINAQIRALVADRRAKKDKIVLTDCDLPAGFIGVADLDPADGIHPTDAGHRKLAALMMRGIQEANAAGMLTKPKDTGISDEPGEDDDEDNNTCDKEYGSGQSHGPFTTQQGSGLDDGLYTHKSTSKGSVYEMVLPRNFNYTFARLKNPYGNHDLVLIGDDDGIDPDLGREYTIYNNIGGTWSEDSSFVLRIADQCIARGVRFADVNADGTDDFLCISPNGDVWVSINQGGYAFKPRFLWKQNEGPKQDRVRIADIDGDGRADYCTIADNGDITCWRNGGQGNEPEYWQPLGIMFLGQGKGDLNGVRFVDLNGDYRDDWMWMDNTGKAWTYLNNRKCTKGTLKPQWRPATGDDFTGLTHGGMGEEIDRSDIHIIKVFGEPEAFGLDGRRDYVWVKEAGRQSTTGYSRFQFLTWKNEGSGATKLKGDGSRYCNMMGHSNGAMDYVWIHSTGYMVLYESLGGTFPDDPPYWGPNYQIWSAKSFTGSEIHRSDLHLADWDGDGYCDIIYVKPKNGGKVEVWLNQYAKTSNFDSWVHETVDGIGGKCHEHSGVGLRDVPFAFADIDGDGRADYLCMEPDGRTSGYLNHKDGPEYISQFKKTEGKDRANLRWVDVNGDGRADMLWVDKFNGDATVFYNRGPIPASGSAYTWDNVGPKYQGSAQGACLHYPDLDGDGRADMHEVDSITNTAKTWFNLCPGSGTSTNGDDDDTLTSPPLPEL